MSNPPRRKILQNSTYWWTNDGHCLRIVDMPTEHLVNAREMARRWTVIRRALEEPVPLLDEMDRVIAARRHLDAAQGPDENGDT